MTQQKPNKKDFSTLIEKNQSIIHKITMIYTNGWNDREDLFQEICLQLWKSYPSFREDAKITTWMYKVALNTAISTIRRKSRAPSFEPLLDIDQIDDESQTDKEQVQSLYKAISKLNRIDKAIIILWLEEKSYDEIAVIMGTSKKNVSVKLVRIKRKLEELITNTETQKP